MTTELKEREETMYVSPRVNIIEEKEAVRIEAELPGVAKEGLEIEVKGDELTLIGRRAKPALEGTPLVRERRNFDYRRVFALSRAVDAAGIKANMENGVLTLQIPKAEHMKPRKITVN